MFKTVKTKIIAITIGIFVIFSVILFGVEILNYNNFKTLKIETCDNQVEHFASDLDSFIKQMQDNALSLGLSGASFYYYDRQNKNFVDFIVRDNFRNNNKLSIGGGIWFEPYVINPNQKRYSAYALANGKNVEIDPIYEGEQYNYLNQNWYKTIKREYDKNHRNVLIWTAPYVDKATADNLMITVGDPIYDKHGKFIGMATVDWLLDSIIDKLRKLRPTPSSLVLFADKKNDYIVALCDNNSKTSIMTGKSLKSIVWYDSQRRNGQEFIYKNSNYIYFYKTLHNNMILTVSVPTKELFAIQKMRLMIGIILRIISCIIMGLITYVVLTKNINNPINVLTAFAEEIGAGNLDKQIEIKEPLEFAKLAQTFNKMISDIKQYVNNIHKMKSDKEKIEAELNIAKEIQESVLPKTFPPYPERVDLDIYATMVPAIKVGGDFYDFYFTDDDHFVITIADVSGHGVPAAMFMMTAKTLIKNLALRRMLPVDIFNYTNQKLCENNEQGFFMTAFFAIIDLKTGQIEYVNAGHNPPLISKDNNFEFMNIESNIALGVLDDTIYQSGKLQLKPSESILLYTDGVTEAINDNHEFFGDENLLKILENQALLKSQKIIELISGELKKYSKGCEQADDITMLSFKYTGKNNLSEKVDVPAQISDLKPFLTWLENLCIKCNMTNEQKSMMLMSAEEVFVNIAYYAYPDKIKEKIQETNILFKYIESTKEVSLIFMDSGVKYNPLTQSKTPDINQPLDKREAGGLGILMVKNMMSSVNYCYKNKQNVLTLTLDI